MAWIFVGKILTLHASRHRHPTFAKAGAAAAMETLITIKCILSLLVKVVGFLAPRIGLWARAAAGRKIATVRLITRTTPLCQIHVCWKVVMAVR